MRRGRNSRAKTWKAVSWPVLMALILVSILSGFLFSPPVSATALPLTVGNVDLSIEDYGVLPPSISWNYITQTHLVFGSYLAIYHDAYPAGGGGTDIATGYGAGTGDFTLEEQNVYLQSDTVQETYSSFTQTGVSGVSNDLRIYQRAFSSKGEDWVIIMWKLENIYGKDINDLRVGMSFHTKLDSTSGDDIDNWNAVDSIYYIEDESSGTTLMGFGSADPAVPLNHYYGSPAGIGGEVDPADDKSMYEALTTNKVHGSATDMTCMVGWEVGTLPAGSTIFLPLVIAFGTKYQDVSWAISKAKGFLVLQLARLRITEVQDSASTDNVKIEVYNEGEWGVSVSEIYLSPDGFTAWTSGGWSNSPIMPGEYSVYSLGPGEAFTSTEGGKISLHYSTGSIFDSISFGQAGSIPDPLRDETASRFWGGANYTEQWTRDPTPTYGSINDGRGRLDPPSVVLN
ncbi:MAG: hypothetical protein ACE5KV_08845, partial [Thermoplasmata archaeon]